MLHKLAIALILLAVLCFAAVPVLGASLFVVGVGIETVGYLVWAKSNKLFLLTNVLSHDTRAVAKVSFSPM